MYKTILIWEHFRALSIVNRDTQWVNYSHILECERQI